MSFSRRPKIRLNSQVDLNRPALEPCTTTLCQMRWLRHLGDTEYALIELPRRILHSGRHGELNVFDRDYWHGGIYGAERCGERRVNSCNVALHGQVVARPFHLKLGVFANSRVPNETLLFLVLGVAHSH